MVWQFTGDIIFVMVVPRKNKGPTPWRTILAGEVDVAGCAKKEAILSDFRSANESVRAFSTRNRLPKSMTMTWLLKPNPIPEHKESSKSKSGEQA